MLNIVHSAGYYLYLIFEECKNLGGRDGKMILKSKGVKEVRRDASCFWRLLWGHWALADLGINGRGLLVEQMKS